MSKYHKYHTVRFKFMGGPDTYNLVKKVNYEDDKPVSIENPENYQRAVVFATKERVLIADDYGWKDDLVSPKNESS